MNLVLQRNSDLIRSKQERLALLLKEQKRRRGLNDLWFFDKHILGYKDMTDKNEFHGTMCHIIEDDKHRNILLLEPRGSLKSSCITIGYSLREIVRNPDIRILIASEEFMTAQKFLEEITGHIEENVEFKSLYGNLKGRGKWSQKEIVVKTRKLHRKEPTITCAGIDVTKVGLHYDLIIIDDPHSSKNITTREQIEKVKTWYRLVLSLLDPGGKLIIIGTRWHYDDLFGWIIDKERERRQLGMKKRYHIKIERAIRDDGTLLWPDRLSREFLEDTKLDQGPYIFSCQYQNEPVDDEFATFKKSWVKLYKPESELPDHFRNFTTVDPMRDEEGNDYCAIVTCSLGPDWRAYIRDVVRAKMDEYDTIEAIFQVYKKYKPEKIGFETVAWQKSYYKFVKNEMLRRGKRLPMVELKTDTRITKRMRIRSMIPYWRAGLFLVPGKHLSDLEPGIAHLVDELLRYPRVSNDDCIDALAYMDQLLRRPSIPRILKSTPSGSFYGIRNKALKAHMKGRLGKYNVRVVNQ